MDEVTGVCVRCRENEATVKFEAILLHGGVPYCERCLVEVQTDHARNRAEALPELERRLAELGGPAEHTYPPGSTW